MNFCICRIFGNDLPPRDSPKAKIESLKHVVEQDKNISIEKRWVLNRIIDSEYYDQAKSILEGYKIYEIPFIKSEYRRLTLDQKILYLTNVNSARNFIIKKCWEDYEFAVSLDGDCYFQKDVWNDVVKQIKENNTLNHYGLYYKRIINGMPGPNGEPMIIFRRNSEIFDESIGIGHGCRASLLWKLGYQTPNWNIEGNQCKNVGSVLHIGLDQQYECNVHERVKARAMGIQNLLIRAEKIYGIKMI
jgi:hypothetical protein